MSYLKVINPEKVDVKTGFKGQYYTVPAGEEKSFPEDLAHWFVDVYPFLKLAEVTKTPVLEKVVEVVEAEVEEKEVKVEKAPKKVAKK